MGFFYFPVRERTDSLPHPGFFTYQVIFFLALHFLSPYGYLSSPARTFGHSLPTAPTAPPHELSKSIHASLLPPLLIFHIISRKCSQRSSSAFAIRGSTLRRTETQSLPVARFPPDLIPSSQAKTGRINQPSVHNFSHKVKSRIYSFSSR